MPDSLKELARGLQEPQNLKFHESALTFPKLPGYMPAEVDELFREHQSESNKMETIIAEPGISAHHPYATLIERILALAAAI